MGGGASIQARVQAKRAREATEAKERAYEFAGKVVGLLRVDHYQTTDHGPTAMRPVTAGAAGCDACQAIAEWELVHRDSPKRGPGEVQHAAE